LCRSWQLLDRGPNGTCSTVTWLTAEFAGIPALIVITKLDLADEDAGLMPELEYYERIGYPVLLTSAQTVDMASRTYGMPSQAISRCLIGKSGVGKSSLLNALQPGLGLRVSEVGGRRERARAATPPPT
jgi:ribosome biogenesis GTPase / thiamine phosphate phosphatase